MEFNFLSLIQFTTTLLASFKSKKRKPMFVFLTFVGFSFIFCSGIYGQTCMGCMTLKAEATNYFLCAGGEVKIRGVITGNACLQYKAYFTWKKDNVIIVTDSISDASPTISDVFIDLNVNSTGTYTLTITDFSGGCPNGDPINITVESGQNINPTIIATPAPNLTCKDPSIVLSVGGSFPQGTTIEWTGSGFSVTSPNLTVTAAGTYSAKVMTPTGCSGTGSINISDSRSKPSYNQFPTDYSTRNGLTQTISMAQGIPSGHTVSWQRITAINVDTLALKKTGTGNLINEPYTLSSERSTGLVEYRATLKNNTSGCESDPLIFRVKILSDQIFIPEIITPNNDGANDTWNVVFPNEEEKEIHEVHVFNRLGIEVFTRDNMIEPWDTNNCPNGVYFYLIINREDTSKVYKGALTILGKAGN